MLLEHYYPEYTYVVAWPQPADSPVPVLEYETGKVRRNGSLNIHVVPYYLKVWRTKESGSGALR